MNNQELASKILSLVGGKENVATATNCMTRLRLRVIDLEKVNEAELGKTDGVMGVVMDTNLQIIVGPGKAQKIKDIFVTDLDVTELGKEDKKEVQDWEANKAAKKSEIKQTPIKKLLKTIANIFIPLLPAIIAAGLFNGFASLIGQLGTQGVITTDTGFWFLLQQVFSLIGTAFLTYFAIFTGINAAKQFGATEALGGMIGAMTISPIIVTLSTYFSLYNEKEPLSSILTTGKGGIIGVIFGVWVLSIIEKKLRKIIPDTLDLILTPFIALLLSAVVLVAVIMPLAGFASDGLVYVLTLLIDSTNPVLQVISGFVLSALFLPMVLLGLHHGLIPLYAIQLQATGSVSLFPVLAMAGAGQVGAAVAIYFKAKKVGNERMIKVISGALPAGLLGVGEPLIYGVTLPLGKPFITAGIGAGFGGAFVMLMGVSATAWGPSGLVAIPMMLGFASMFYFFIGLVISYIGGFIITSIFVKPEEVKEV